MRSPPLHDWLDGVACTESRCVATKCVYTVQDDLCTGNDKCIKLNGCCPDADNDGYADESCGGSDCNDQDRDTHPGARASPANETPRLTLRCARCSLAASEIARDRSAPCLPWAPPQAPPARDDWHARC